MIQKRILSGRSKAKVAVAQASPVFMDKRATIDKACKLIKEAGGNGAELVVFPEAFVAGYPAIHTIGWESRPSEWSDYVIALQDNAIVVGGEDTAVLGEAAKAAGAYVVMGCNELDGRPGSRTVYNSLVFIGRDGKVMGRHRKLMPTFTERTYWGMGDASDLMVFDTEIGRIGGLICAENLMTLVKAAMMSKGEEFHIAVWPGAWSGRGRDHLMDPQPDLAGGDCWIYPVIRSYALEAQCFVLSASGILRDKDFPPRWKHVKASDHTNYSFAVGGSAIVNPHGRFMAGPVVGEETILYADCYANQIKTAKALFDCLGHYSRWDVISLQVRQEPWGPVARPRVDVPESELRRISEECEVSIEKLAEIIEELNG
ncbi:MAG: carbon-nitrogen hydrolase family protein [Chloroflexi bacterium]|nr:carbon-nitrogen hydrolase family protein [Chloroflexota bacterium]